MQRNLLQYSINGHETFQTEEKKTYEMVDDGHDETEEIKT